MFCKSQVRSSLSVKGMWDGCKLYWRRCYYCQPKPKSMHCNAVEFFLLTFSQTPNQIAHIIHEAYSPSNHYARASKPCHKHCPATILKSTHYSLIYMWRVTVCNAVLVMLHGESGRWTLTKVHMVSHTIILSTLPLCHMTHRLIAQFQLKYLPTLKAMNYLLSLKWLCSIWHYLSFKSCHITPHLCSC